jgi:hypothetical protein
MSSLAWTIAWDARRPETTGHTYHRYPPGESLSALPPNLQVLGTTTSARLVSELKIRVAPLNSST